MIRDAAICCGTCCRNGQPCPPQVVRLHAATRTAEFDALIPLIEAEKLDWAFVRPAGNCPISG
jgi:phosphoserine phosphatase